MNFRSSGPLLRNREKVASVAGHRTHKAYFFESPAALITELLRSRVCNPLARSAGVFLATLRDIERH